MTVHSVLGLLVAIFILSGCATTGTPQAQVERMTAEELEKLLPPPVATVSLEELVADAKQGKTADEMIEKIRASGSRYELTPTQTLELSKQGVDAKVLDYIQQSNELAKQNAIAEEINKREKAKLEAQKQLRRERHLSRSPYYDPFWGSRFGAFYGHPFYGRYWRGSRFGLGLHYGYPYYW
ncbi:MAG: hypothetical protein ACT4OH_08425 [Methylophilaceae bacterium]